MASVEYHSPSIYPVEASHTVELPSLSHEQVSLRAYSKWLERGCPNDDSDTDWFDALQELEREQTRQEPTLQRGQA